MPVGMIAPMPPGAVHAPIADINLAVVPIQVVTEPGADRTTVFKGKRRGDDRPRRHVLVVVDNHRVICRNVDGFADRRDNFDHAAVFGGVGEWCIEPRRRWPGRSLCTEANTWAC